jgi:hypothetical protein
LHDPEKISIAEAQVFSGDAEKLPEAGGTPALEPYRRDEEL